MSIIICQHTILNFQTNFLRNGSPSVRGCATMKTKTLCIMLPVAMARKEMEWLKWHKTETSGALLLSDNRLSRITKQPYKPLPCKNPIVFRHVHFFLSHCFETKMYYYLRLINKNTTVAKFLILYTAKKQKICLLLLNFRRS